MKQGERLTVSAYYESNKVLGYPTAIFDCVVGSGSYIGVIILFFTNFEKETHTFIDPVKQLKYEKEKEEEMEL